MVASGIKEAISKATRIRKIHFKIREPSPTISAADLKRATAAAKQKGYTAMMALTRKDLRRFAQKHKMPFTGGTKTKGQIAILSRLSLDLFR